MSKEKLLDQLEAHIESNRHDPMNPGSDPLDPLGMHNPTDPAYSHLDQWEHYARTDPIGAANQAPVIPEPAPKPENPWPEPRNLNRPPMVDPAIHTRPGGCRSPDPPDPWVPEKPGFYREPPVPRPRLGGSGAGTAGSGKGFHNPRMAFNKVKAVWCPDKDKAIVPSECSSRCKHHDPRDRIHNCRLKREEAKRLARK